jgi:hypothetical protein
MLLFTSFYIRRIYFVDYQSIDISFRDHRIHLRQSLDLRNYDMLVHHMRGRADEAEFDNRAIGADEVRGQRAAARCQSEEQPMARRTAANLTIIQRNPTHLKPIDVCGSVRFLVPIVPKCFT